jgi:hypothetical protein
VTALFIALSTLGDRGATADRLVPFDWATFELIGSDDEDDEHEEADEDDLPLIETDESDLSCSIDEDDDDDDGGGSDGCESDDGGSA